MTAFEWSSRRERAAALVADDQLSDEQIAEQIGVSRQSLATWKQHPDFQARVQSIITSVRRKVAGKTITEKSSRVAALDDRAQRMRQVIDERAADTEWIHVPGYRTGLLVHRRKQIGAGRDAQVVDEFEVDTGLLAEMRATEKQAAQELHQWDEGKTTHEHTGKDGVPIQFVVVHAPGEEGE